MISNIVRASPYGNSRLNDKTSHLSIKQKHAVQHKQKGEDESSLNTAILQPGGMEEGRDGAYDVRLNELRGQQSP